MTSTLLVAIKLVLMYARVLVLNVSIAFTLLCKEVIMFEKLNPDVDLLQHRYKNTNFLNR